MGQLSAGLHPEGQKDPAALKLKQVEFPVWLWIVGGFAVSAVGIGAFVATEL